MLCQCKFGNCSSALSVVFSCHDHTIVVVISVEVVGDIVQKYLRALFTEAVAMPVIRQSCSES